MVGEPEDRSAGQAGGAQSRGTLRQTRRDRQPEGADQTRQRRPQARLALRPRGLLRRHSLAGTARLGKADGDRLLAAGDLLAATTALQRAVLHLVHHLLDLLRRSFRIFAGHGGSLLAVALRCRITLVCCGWFRRTLQQRPVPRSPAMPWRVDD